MPQATQTQKKLFPEGDTDIFGGIAPDEGIYARIPKWFELKNVWKNDKALWGRPHELGVFSGPIAGLVRTHTNELLVVTNLDLGASPGRASFDHQRGITIYTTGDLPYVWNGETISTIDEPGTFAVVTAFGHNKAKLFLVQNTDRRTIRYSESGDYNDFGTLIADAKGINDEHTEGGRIKRFAHDIIDIMEFGNELVVFTRLAVYVISFDVDAKVGFVFTVRKVDNVEVWDVKPRRFSQGILFLNSRGLWLYSIGQGGPFVAQVPMDNVERTVQRSLTESEACIGVDEQRGNYLLQPSMSSDTYIYSYGMKTWTSTWDIHFGDFIEVAGHIYSMAPDGSRVNKFDDFGDGETFYDIKLKSGLMELDGNAYRKRFLTMGMEVDSTDNPVWYAMDANADEVRDEPPGLMPHFSDEAMHKIEVYVGCQGYRFSLLAELQNYGRKIFRSVYFDYFLKGLRLRR